MKNILLIAPEYMGYAKAIELELEGLGFSVTYISDRPNSGILSKIITRLTHKFNDVLHHNKFRALMDENYKDFSIIFVINGEGLSTQFVGELSDLYPDSKKIFYTWDSFANKAQNYNIFKNFTRRYTFDYIDAEHPSWEYKPLFFIETEITSSNEKLVDLCFIGAFQQHRFKMIRQFLKAKQINGRYKLVSQNKFLYFLQLARNFIHIKDFLAIVQPYKIKFEDVMDTYNSSLAVLDLPNPKQSGLTIRVFETLAAGQKLVTTSQTINRENFYDPEYVYVFDDNELSSGLRKLQVFINDQKSIPSPDLSAYTLRNWLVDILEL